MTDTKFDVLGIGNAIVDIIARENDDFLASHDMVKGSMMLIDEAQADSIYNDMGPATEISGGSAGNTIAGVASFGGRAAYFGKVADDELGRIFRHDIRAIGVHFETAPLTEGLGTARSMILVTPDGERTMNTFLGACGALGPDDIDAEIVGASAITYMEGYLWDPEEAKKAFLKAADIAHARGRKTALTLSDSFCVDRYRDEFIGLLRDNHIDYLFANEAELKSLYQTSDFQSAVDAIRKDCALAAVTIGEKGALAIAGDAVYESSAFPVEEIVDLTGAGDLFAAGFMTALTRDKSLDDALELGCLAASEVISHLGARPNTSLKELAGQKGIEL
ncbi:adenosine kinase [Coralliovum pocilloporae]|uniref:adenosine kinase n=1 Tax=Coralliovum pocilloporae TaxID=3066369 RepID=UPI003307B7D3